MGLFFKSAEPKAEKMYPKEVLEIHHEFETASIKLLEEAQKALKKASSAPVQKISRLLALGFKQANQVTDVTPILEKAELSKEQIKLIQYYQQNYPLNKFITEEQVKEICYKYNLVCGDVERFKGFVPEKNLQEIERFKLKKADKSYKLKYGSSIYSKKDWDAKFSLENRKPGGISLGGMLKYDDVEETDIEDILTLQICAPVKDMDISGLELIEGYKLEKIHIPDPVVLQPVVGGYLILTAWGDEASDPIVVNEILN